mmetsp:Transcript_16416/g.27805  ORF Transcript_16416/g.27805 Transcript_16416/m.27805 type:complete len:133 (+) Transcript_16416:84-482(+)
MPERVPNGLQVCQMGGNVHSWGSGEMGQLGFPSLEDLPKDQDGYPYEPRASVIKEFKQIKICQIAGGDGHTAAVTVHGKLYSWGASACGQLGHCDTAQMPKDDCQCCDRVLQFRDVRPMRGRSRPSTRQGGL